MLSIRQHNYSVKPTGALFTLALSITSLGTVLVNPVFADIHASTEPATSVLGYESALAGYKALDGSEKDDWKKSNDTVAQIGGWRSYANEAYKANQSEANAKKDAENQAEAASDIPESAAATPVTAAASKSVDPSSEPSENAAAAMAVNISGAQASESSSSRPLTIEYQSAMSSYRLYDDNPPGDWKAANERVGEIGGWRRYAKEAYEASKLEAQAEADAGNSQ